MPFVHAKWWLTICVINLFIYLFIYLFILYLFILLIYFMILYLFSWHLFIYYLLLVINLFIPYLFIYFLNLLIFIPTLLVKFPRWSLTYSVVSWYQVTKPKGTAAEYAYYQSLLRGTIYQVLHCQGIWRNCYFAYFQCCLLFRKGLFYHYCRYCAIFTW
jgi:hypothetical protein